MSDRRLRSDCEGCLYLSIFSGEQPEVFAQEIDMICVRTLSLRPQLKKTCGSWNGSEQIVHVGGTRKTASRKADCSKFISLMASIYFKHGPILHPCLDPHPIHHDILVSSLCGQVSFLLGLATWFINILSLLDASTIKSQPQSPPSFCTLRLFWDIKIWSAVQASVGSRGNGRHYGPSVMKDAERK